MAKVILLSEFDLFEEAINGLRATSNAYEVEDEIEAVEVDLEDLHHSIDIKEEGSDLEVQEDYIEETPGHSQIEVEEMEFKLEDLHHSIDISDELPISEVPLDREYEPEGQKRMDQYSHLINCEKLEDAIDDLRVPSNHHEMEVMDAELKELHTSIEIKEEYDYDLEHQEDSDEETPGHSQIEVEEMEKLEDLHHSIEISDELPILEVPLDREYEPERGQKRMDKPGLRVPSNHHEMEVMDDIKEDDDSDFEYQEDSDEVLDDEKSSGKSVVKKSSQKKIFKPFVCNKCKKTFAKYPHLVQHERFHEDIKAFGCDFEGCEERFAMKMDLEDHERKVHTRERPFTCDVCEKSFLTKSVYYQHRLIHSNDRRFGCEICGQKFFRSYVLKGHMRSHNREKPYSCEICKKKFRDKSNLNRHLRTVHSK